MRILAFDTALQSCSAAFVDTEARRVIKRAEAMDKGHAEALMPMLADIVAEARVSFSQIDRLVVTIGPGSFTGLRVGLAAARGLALAAERPLIGIGTMQALATSYVLWRKEIPTRFATALDARRGEVYFQIFNQRGQAQGPARLCKIAEAALQIGGEPILLAGSGAPFIAEVLEARGKPHDCDTDGLRSGPDPVVLARLGEVMGLPDTPPELLYLRPPDAKPQQPSPVEGNPAS